MGIRAPAMELYVGIICYQARKCQSVRFLYFVIICLVFVVNWGLFLPVMLRGVTGPVRSYVTWYAGPGTQLCYVVSRARTFFFCDIARDETSGP